MLNTVPKILYFTIQLFNCGCKKYIENSLQNIDAFRDLELCKLCIYFGLKKTLLISGLESVSCAWAHCAYCLFLF